MNEYIFLMHDDIDNRSSRRASPDWQSYIARLQAGGHFVGGSAIGGGTSASKSGVTTEITRYLSGFMRVRAESLDQARSLLTGNPVFEAGGTVEIRELPREKNVERAGRES
ncbi:MAG TPA: YciI family protein [Rhizomicrobium sp.]